MMHVSDIEKDIGTGDLRGLQAAFRALVGYPKEETIEGAGDSATLVALMRRVCYALDGDASTVPRETMDVIVEVTGAKVHPSYHYAAAAVLDSLPIWSVRFMA